MSELQLNLNSNAIMPVSQDNDNQIRRLRHSAFTLSFFCLYLILFHLSMPQRSKEPGSPTKKPTAKWNMEETEALISFLRNESVRNGGTSFKEGSFTAAAAGIKHLHTEGAIKTAAHCRTKWSSVSFLLSMITNR
jgi:hypothetical protein